MIYAILCRHGQQSTRKDTNMISTVDLDTLKRDDKLVDGNGDELNVVSCRYMSEGKYAVKCRVIGVGNKIFEIHATVEADESDENIKHIVFRYPNERVIEALGDVCAYVNKAPARRRSADRAR